MPLMPIPPMPVKCKLLRLQKHLANVCSEAVNESTDGHYRTFTSTHKSHQDVSSFLRC